MVWWYGISCDLDYLFVGVGDRCGFLVVFCELFYNKLYGYLYCKILEYFYEYWLLELLLVNMVKDS